MYLKCQRTANPKFPLCKLLVSANSKNKTEDLIYQRSVSLPRLAPLLLYIIIKDSSNLSLDSGPLPHSGRNALRRKILVSNS